MKENEKLLVNGGYPLHTFEQLKEVYQSYITNEKDRKSIEDAYAFILKKHDGQLRRSGEPYYHHLIEVAYILANLQAGPATIVAGLLHDVVEDTDVTIEEVEKKWGSDVAKLVDSLTKIQRLKLSKIESEDFEAEDHRKIFIGMAKDIRVIIIKLADRLHNMRTLSSLKPERQIALSKETKEVFVPIAHRLGLDTIKCELADLCLKYLEPAKYDEIVKLLEKKEKTLAKSLSVFQKKLADILFAQNIPFEIVSRVKSISSIYEKMYVKGHTFDEIYDILALRIITDTEMRCYEILGLIHQSYKPVPMRFKDYIAMPKPNMYQSLHTTVVSGDGNVYEVQIRTKYMDEIAESGVAAHWAYKEKKGYDPKEEQKEIEDKLHWFRDFVSMSNESSDNSASEYMENLTHDIFEANVYVFTPNGKVIELTQGSTPIDFAYRIHTKVGDSAVGALVNGTMVPLNTVLKTGDMVEIKTSKTSPGPSEGWLDFVKTNLAKSQIKKFIAKKNAELLRGEKIAKGKQSALDSFKDKGIEEAEMVELLSQEKVLKQFEFEDLEELYIGFSNRKPTPAAVIEFLGIKKPLILPTGKAKVRNEGDSSCPVYCKGADRIAIQLASCCTPIPGDMIKGYITRGKGITVHRHNCPNIAKEGQRVIDVYWKENIEYSTYPVDIVMEANDRPNLLIDIMNTMSSAKVTVSSIHAQLMSHNRTLTLVRMTIYVSDLKRLNDIFNILLNVKGVYDVKRVIH
ncbi:MAG: bifunctional (p)ppGpp synthetase/guanosine-3',5'-bis(diphosphate) 3'-pyrophosphohydrolase [Bacilli bacterium]|nr:bifunctional (p)ppGpp synthetase/guanosine-3',5'-bis(diphosphate) 3'-pyrophosphohydrolase [Bacilli bacterium]